MASNAFAVEKLDENNFDTWCGQMRGLLIHQEAWKVTNGDLLKPETNVENWIKIDEKALATLILSVKPSQLNYIKSCTTSNEAWCKLKEIYKPSGPIRKVTLYKSLLGLRLSDDSAVVQHVNDFTNIVDKLAETGVALDDEMKGIILLSSLPQTYEGFVIAVETRDVLPKFDILKQKLLEEAARRKQQNGTAGNETQAFVAYKENNDKHRNANKEKSKNDGKCYNCGKRGHYAAKCRAKNKTKTQSQNSPHNAFYSKQLFTHKPYMNSWCVDSGATSHMCNDRKMFTTFSEYNENVVTAGSKMLRANGIGEVLVKTKDGSVNLKNVLYVPDIQVNFLSVAKATDNGVSIKFNKNVAILENMHSKIMITKAYKTEGLYIIENKREAINLSCAEKSLLWHNRYGHINFNDLHELSSKNIVNGLEDIRIHKNIVCIPCLKSKITEQPFKKSNNRAKDLLEIIHADVCGPFNINSIGGSRYFLTFIDDKSRFVFIYFLANKSEVFDKFKLFKAYVERQTGKKIKILRTDNGREFVNNNFNNCLQEAGISRQLTVPYTPQQNGVAERYNRTLVEMARSMLVHADLEEKFWAEAVACAAHIRNRSSTRALTNTTPYEIWNNKKPIVKYFKVFGCEAVALDKTYRNNKFQAKGKRHIMVGYDDISKGYRLFDLEKKIIVIRRDVKFNENSFFKSNRDLNYTSDIWVCPQTQLNSENENTSSIMYHNETEIFEDALAQEITEGVEEAGSSDEGAEQLVSQNENIPGQHSYGPGRPRIIRTGKPGRPRKQKQSLNIMVAAKTIRIPESVTEAMQCEQSLEWKTAMEREYDSLISNNTWSLVDPPEKKPVIQNKWVFALKTDDVGNVERYKARLVAKGCSQIYGVNYEETFSPVIRHATIRMLFALAAELQLFLHQMDICTAYLNGNLREDIYMRQPEMFRNNDFPDKVLKLNKALYGLKQSGREWHIKLDLVLKGLGFVPCATEPCLYKASLKCGINLIAVYVDDIIIASKSKGDLNYIKSYISEQFKSVDKGPIKNFLNMQIERDGETGDVYLSQTKYINSLLQEYNMQECRTATTPLDPGYQVIVSSESESPKVDQTKYQALIGSLTYISVCTRPDISHSICKLAQANKDPRQEHEVGAKHVLRYLAGTKDVKLRYYKCGQHVQGYADADWGSNQIDRKSFTGFVFFLAGAAFSWESKKQRTVALSSTEAEYMALATAAKEAVYLRRLMIEIGCFNEIQPICIYGDNQSAQNLAKHCMYHSRSKHIDIRYNFIRELIENNEVILKYMNTNELLADILTKNLKKQKHMYLFNKIGFV